jgi:hypothetical protein
MRECVTWSKAAVRQFAQDSSYKMLVVFALKLSTSSSLLSMPIPPAIVDLNPVPVQTAPPTTGVANLAIYTPSSVPEISNMVLSPPTAEEQTNVIPPLPVNNGTTGTTLSTTPTEAVTWTSLGAASASEPTWTPYQYPYNPSAPYQP